MNIQTLRRFGVLLIFLISSSFFCACSGSNPAQVAPSGNEQRKSRLSVLTPEASGAVCFFNDSVSIDASNTSEGYVMVDYHGSADKAKLQMTVPDGVVYTYTLTADGYGTFPLTGENGSYHIDILEHVFDNNYALAYSQDIDVTLSDDFKPFLYPNKYVWFTTTSSVISLGEEISSKSSDDLDFVQNCYYYVIQNITYDTEKAKNTPTDYVPEVDSVLTEKKGICFDYASLLAALLRSQSIPTKLEVGYSGQVYHAWISVYLEEKGWVDHIIEFNGSDWSLMDPTLAASNDSKAVGQYIGDGTHYVVKYSY